MSRAHELFAHLRSQGESAVSELIADFQSENLWVDFKRSADNGSGTKLHQSDRENFAKAISGFANSDGGVIIWGVDCRRDPTSGADLPSGKYPIQQPCRFVSWLENAASGCVTPPAPGLEHAVIASENSAESLVASLIPPSDVAPHQCLQPAGKLQYYMRAGSNFVSVPHAVLAGLFGRRPQPKLFTFYEGKPLLRTDPELLDLEFGVRLMNHGPAPASNPYVSFKIMVSRPNCRVNFRPDSSGNWAANQAYGIYFNLTSVNSFRLAPHSPVRPARFTFQLAPPFEDRYLFEMHFGADGAAPGHVSVELSNTELAQAYDTAVGLMKQRPWEEAMQEIFPVFLGQKGNAA
jgi:Putative DNA-binding domain